MQKIINNPETVVDEMLEGFCLNYSDLVTNAENKRVIKSHFTPKAGKVGIVTGGGSGHMPAFCGYVGKAVVDAVAVGEVFSSPSARTFLDAFKAADGGAGIACLYGNYQGDNMNVKLAIRMAKKEGIEVKTVVANDDVASAPKEEKLLRRGVAGEIFMWKIAAAAAEQGSSLDEVIRLAQKTIDNTRSLGVGLTPCCIPAVGHPNFTIEDGMMEVGIGHHGEPGTAVRALISSEEIAKEMVERIVNDLPFIEGDSVAVIVSGLGSTPLMEQYIFFKDVASELRRRGIEIERSYVGNYFTSLEMAGVTLSIMRIDHELRELLAAPCRSAGLSQGEI